MITAVSAALRDALDVMEADLELQMRLLAGEVGTRARNRLIDAADVPLLAAGWPPLKPMVLKPVTASGESLPRRLVQFSRSEDQLMYVAWDQPNTITVTTYRATEFQVLDALEEDVLPVDQALWETL
jgi:hypothetical protein